MTKTFIAKKIVSSIIGIGTTTIVNAIIRNNVQPETVTQKVTVTSASVAIGWMASDATSDWTESKIDEAIIWWNENVTKTSK